MMRESYQCRYEFYSVHCLFTSTNIIIPLNQFVNMKFYQPVLRKLIHCRRVSSELKDQCALFY